jgi:hypothetical protein
VFWVIALLVFGAKPPRFGCAWAAPSAISVGGQCAEVIDVDP